MNVGEFIGNVIKLKEILEKSSGDELKVSFNDTFFSIVFSTPGKEDREIEICRIIENSDMESVAEDKDDLETVFVVYTGKYSDRRVVSVCSDMKIAEDVSLLFNEDKHSIDEFIIDSYANVPRDHSVFKIKMEKDGTVHHVVRESFEYCGDRAIEHSRHIDNNGILDIVVLAKDENHAVKIANEFRAFVIASDSWKKGNHWLKGRPVQKID